MIDTPIKTCSIDSCRKCDINSKTNCTFNPGQLFRFYLIAFPSFIIGGIGIYNFNANSFIIWLVTIGVFFLVIEIRILCSHCPHYEKSSSTLSCWANYGAPKLWKYRPGPMNKIEKSILILGFIVVWGYPVIFLYLAKNWIVMTIYIFSVSLFFTILRLYNCKICINFSCPLNNVNIDTRNKFLKNNPLIYESWKTNSKQK